MIDRRGNKRRNITRTPSFWEAQQRWSPNGRLIAYVRFISGGPWKSSLRLVTREGTRNITLDSPKTNGDEPSWSPDGRSIVFVSRRDGNRGPLRRDPLRTAPDESHERSPANAEHRAGVGRTVTRP